MTRTASVLGAAVAALVALVLLPSAASALERVTVPDGRLQLPGLVARPGASGPRPAVVLLPGCAGGAERWLSAAAARGYVALAIDSFKARGIAHACATKGRARGAARAPGAIATAGDARAALAWLRAQPAIAADRVAVVGWAGGASGALAAVSGRPGGFAAAIAVRPDCGTSALRRFRPAVVTRVMSARRTGSCRALARHAGGRMTLQIVRDRTSAVALRTLAQTVPAPSSPPSIFDPQAWVNAPLAADAPLDPDQSAVVALRSQVNQFGTWVNTTTWSAPVYVVGPDQPRVAIHVNTAFSRYSWADDALLATDLDSVPLPPDASPAGPPESKTVSWSDHELIVYQPSTDQAWELYHLVNGQSGWSVTDGGRITHLSTSDGSYSPWLDGKAHGMTGSGIPLLTSLQRIDELQHGSIDHTVALSLPHVRKGTLRKPATRTDGDFTSWDAIPEGTRFRLPASLDVDSLPLTPYAKIVAKAIQAHGAVVVDKDCRAGQSSCPAVTFKAEDPRPRPGGTVVNPYAAIFGGTLENHLFDNFPWDKMQVLAAP